MVVFLPLVLALLVVALLSGATSFLVLLPMVLALGAGAVFVGIALKDGHKPPDPSVRTLPTDHLRRQLYLALRPQRRAQRQQDRDPDAE
jgi:hypothetical protein